MKQRDKAIVLTFGYFLALTVVAGAVCLVLSHIWNVTPSAVSDTQAPIDSAPESSVRWTPEIEEALARREDYIRSLFVAPPSDETFLRQASVLLSQSYARVIGKDIFVTAAQLGRENAPYLCADREPFQDFEITAKFPSPDKKSVIYLFFVAPLGTGQGYTGYFVVKNARLTATMSLFMRCDSSYSTLEGIRWIDNERIELTYDVMGEIHKETVIVKEYACTDEDAVQTRSSCLP